MKQARGQKPTDAELQALSRAKNGFQSNLSSVPQQPAMPRSMGERVQRTVGPEGVMKILRDAGKGRGPQ